MAQLFGPNGHLVLNTSDYDPGPGPGTWPGNYIDAVAAPQGEPVAIKAQGVDNDINLLINGKGAGDVYVGSTGQGFGFPVRTPLGGGLFPTSRVYSGSDQSIPHATWTPVNFGGARWNNFGFASGLGSDPSSLVGGPGLYLLGAHVAFDYSAGPCHADLIASVGGSAVRIASLTFSTAGDVQRGSVTTAWLTAGNPTLFQLWVYQATGAALALKCLGAYSPELWAIQLSAR